MAPKNKSKNGIERILSAAEVHGRDSEADHEVGDLQDALRLCWARLKQHDQAAVLKEYFQEHPTEDGHIPERWERG